MGDKGDQVEKLDDLKEDDPFADLHTCPRPMLEYLMISMSCKDFDDDEDITEEMVKDFVEHCRRMGRISQLGVEVHKLRLLGELFAR